MDDEIEYYPSHFSNVISSVVGIFEDYGWYMLISLIILAYVYKTSLKSLIAQYHKKREENEYSAKYHKNPDLLSARLTAQEKHTLEIQEKYKKAVEEHQKKLKEKETRKREELSKKFGDELGNKLGSGEEQTKKSFKPDYNPLMGGGSSSNYRPPKRSACGGGGCG